jgi:hypothetical protein
MLRCTLKGRYLLRAKLCKGAEALIEDVKSESMTKWMEAGTDGTTSTQSLQSLPKSEGAIPLPEL